MLCSRPVLTATSAAFLLAPVAKALGSGESKMPTSGMPMPAVSAWRRTVFDQPLLGFIGGLLDDLHAHGHLGHPLGDQQRNERAAETEDRREDQQAVVVLAAAASSIRSRPNSWMTTVSSSDDGEVGAQ